MATRRKSSTTAAFTKKDSVSSSTLRVNSEQRIKELEKQVSELKKRLEDLRKAKSQTIVKKDKEYVTSDVPKLGQRHLSNTGSASCSKDSQKSFQEAEKYRQEIADLKTQIIDLKKTHSEELQKIRNESQKDTPSQLELIQLQEKMKDIQLENEKLKGQNEEKQVCIDDLYEQLSRKEAEWCEKEEKLKIELKLSWGEKYQQWMAQTEQKVEELQAANNFLKTLLQRQRPLPDGNNKS